MRATGGVARLLARAGVVLGVTVALAPAAWAGEGEELAWRLAQPEPPAASPGIEPAPGPIALGRIGDIEFEAPTRGALITAGNPKTIPAGVWEYDGDSWHELSEVCGGTDGRIAWAGPEEFWTISDGRPGQAEVEGKLPPLTDDTLCRFSNPEHKGEPLRVMESFAAPAFETASYQPMHAAACLSPDDCWFAGDSLPAQSIDAGTFQLHWDGQSMTEEPYPEDGHAAESMAVFEGRIFEGVRLGAQDREETQQPFPAPLRAIEAAGAASSFQALTELPLYEAGEFAQALDFLHLAAGQEILWAAAGPQSTPPESNPGQVTIVRGTNLAKGQGAWVQVAGPLAPVNTGLFPGDTVTSLAAEPETDSVWFAVDPPSDILKPSATASAVVARIAAQPSAPLEAAETLPGHGGAWKLACPAADDCWLVTTVGWLYHRSPAALETLPRDSDPAFETLITERPEDQGLPKLPPDDLPIDDSNSGEEPPEKKEASHPVEPERRTLPLLSHVRSKLHGTVLELSFHLSVKARIRLVGKRGRRVVASTPKRTLRAGNRSLQMQLDVHRWPTKLAVQSHALAPLKTVVVGHGNEDVVSTSLIVPDTEALTGLGPLP